MREGDRYRLAGLVAALVEAGDWDGIENTVAFEGHIAYEGQADFTASLRANSNVGLRRIPGTGRNLYHRLSENPRLEAVFFRYMRSWSEMANHHLVSHVTELAPTRLLDCGGGDAVNAIALATASPDLTVTILEIPQTARIAERRIVEAGLEERIHVHAGDMHAAEFPGGFDVVLFAHQLVIWTMEENTELLRKAFRALRPGGHVVIFNSMSADRGDGPVVAALDSVYFAVLPEEGGMIYRWQQYDTCLTAAGFGAARRLSGVDTPRPDGRGQALTRPDRSVARARIRSVVHTRTGG